MSGVMRFRVIKLWLWVVCRVFLEFGLGAFVSFAEFVLCGLGSSGSRGSFKLVF